MDTSAVLRQRLNGLVESELPALAKQTGQYPVSANHCFRRIVYDAVVANRWDREISRTPSAIANMTEAQLRRAVEIAEAIKTPEVCHQLNAASKGYRRKDSRPG